MVQLSWLTNTSWVRKPPEWFINKTAGDAYIKAAYNITIDDMTFLYNEFRETVEAAGKLAFIRDAARQSQHLKRLKEPICKKWLEGTTCDRFRDAAIPNRFHLEAAAFFWKMLLGKVRNWDKGVKQETLDSEVLSSARGSYRALIQAPSKTVPPSDAPDSRVVVGTQPVTFADVTFDMYERGSTTAFVRHSVTNLIDRVRYEAWVNAGCTGPILPDFLRFALLEEKLTAAKCGDKYIIGKSRIWDVVKHTQIVDDEDLATAARYQYSTHKVSSIVLEIDTPSAVVTPTQATPPGPASTVNNGTAASTQVVPSSKRTVERQDEDNSDQVPLRVKQKNKYVIIDSEDDRLPPPATKTDKKRKRKRREKNDKKGGDSMDSIDEWPSKRVKDKGEKEKRSEGPQGNNGTSSKTPSQSNSHGGGPSEDAPEINAPNKGKKERRAERRRQFERQQQREDDNGDEESESETEEQRTKRIQDEENDREAVLLHAKTREEFNRVNSRKIEHCDLATWIAAEEFFDLPQGTLAAGGDIWLSEKWGLLCSFKNYQISEAYTLYQMELSDKNGFVLANMMGLGKTRTGILVLLLGYLHLRMYLHREKYPAKHLPLQQGHNNAPGACPSQRKSPVLCFCHPESPLHDIDPRVCATLASGSGRSIDAWRQEIVSMRLLETRWCDPSKPRALQFCCMDGNVKEVPAKMQPFTPEEFVEMRVALNPENVLAEYNTKVMPRSYTLGRVPMTETPLWELVSTTENHPHATRTRPSPTAGRFIILCGENTVMKRVLEVANRLELQVKREITYAGGKKCEYTTITIGRHVVKWGRTIFDEFHNAKSEHTRFARLYESLRDNNSGYQWKSWAISGTPLEHGMREVLIFVTLALRGLEDNSGLSNWSHRGPSNAGNMRLAWKNNIYLSIASRPPPPGKAEARPNESKKYEPKGLQMAKSWKKIGNSVKGVGYEHVINTDEYTNLVTAGNEVCAVFMLRRTLETKDPWGKHISALPGVFRVVIRPCRNDRWAEIVEDGRRRIEKVLSAKNNDDVALTRSEMTAIANYPALATFKAGRVEDEGVKAMSCLKGDTLKPHFTDLKNTPLFDKLDDLVEGSAKLGQLRKIAALTNTAMRPNPRHTNADNTPYEPKQLQAKLLVLTYKPASQLLTYLALKKDYGNKNVLLLPGGLKPAVLAKRLRKWRADNGPRFMVCSMAYAEAITLVEAHYVVLMEPQDQQSKQEQGLCRVYRIGQIALITYGYILYNADCQLETEILQRQQFKTRSRAELQMGEEEDHVTKTGGDVDWSGDVVYKMDGLP